MDGGRSRLAALHAAAGIHGECDRRAAAAAAGRSSPSPRRFFPIRGPPRAVASHLVGTSDTAELEHVVATALRGDDAGSEPVEVRTWIDGGAILIVARCELARLEIGSGSHSARIATLAHDVAEAFYRRTGELLRPCGQSSDPQRSLLVLAFSHDETDTLGAGTGSEGHAPLADAS